MREVDQPRSPFGPYILPAPVARLIIRLRPSPPKLAPKWHTLIEIRRPLPRPPRGRTGRHGRRGLSWPFLRIGSREWYWPSEVCVWRKGDAVGVTIWPIQRVRRWLFDRCEGCGERFPWHYSPVATLQHEHRPHTKSVIWARTGCYHHGCAHDPAADYRATQSWDRQWGHDEYLRRTVLNEPPVLAHDLAKLARARREADQAYMVRLVEARRAVAPEFVWKVPRGAGFDADRTDAEQSGGGS